MGRRTTHRPLPAAASSRDLLGDDAGGAACRRRRIGAARAGAFAGCVGRDDGAVSGWV